jgi:hypothetical protein
VVIFYPFLQDCLFKEPLRKSPAPSQRIAAVGEVERSSAGITSLRLSGRNLGNTAGAAATTTSTDFQDVSLLALRRAAKKKYSATLRGQI